MMPIALSALQRGLRRTIAVVSLVVLFTVSNFVFLNLPSYAAPPSSSSSISAEEQIDRAFEETEAAGIQEEIYQQRLQEGQDPEKMPGPFKRIVDAEGKEVPETSLIETSVSKVRELTQKVTGK
ncbi:hypothetical protein [Leptolyngbya sp. FACHB-17]|uniref:hypothetical protein n=1 Tax=unclassified Leptolyngbya TaxID=2650499 RepID=UPI001680BE3A|nr:hypothetical protein [Leptolyngbya sp. FACHB-17]